MRASLALLALVACGENLTPPATDVPPVLTGCVPDLDGALTAAEVPLVLDTAAAYLFTADTAVDLAGAGDGDTRHWDWSDERLEDRAVDVIATALGDQWYAPMFPGGRFVAAGPGGLDGVYSRDDVAVYLHGLASPTGDPPGGRTLLRYAAPVAVLRFPLSAGDAWTETGSISGGTLSGLPYNGTDTYRIAADATGELRLPYVRFTRALRLRTLVTATPAVGGVTSTRRQVSFWFECFGEIGRATGRPDEPAEDFTTAEELRRFAL
jgi:hypothetical protein